MPAVSERAESTRAEHTSCSDRASTATALSVAARSASPGRAATFSLANATAATRVPRRASRRARASSDAAAPPASLSVPSAPALPPPLPLRLAASATAMVSCKEVLAHDRAASQFCSRSRRMSEAPTSASAGSADVPLATASEAKSDEAAAPAAVANSGSRCLETKEATATTAGAPAAPCGSARADRDATTLSSQAARCASVVGSAARAACSRCTDRSATSRLASAREAQNLWRAAPTMAAGGSKSSSCSSPSLRSNHMAAPAGARDSGAFADRVHQTKAASAESVVAQPTPSGQSVMGARLTAEPRAEPPRACGDRWPYTVTPRRRRSKRAIRRAGGATSRRRCSSSGGVTCSGHRTVVTRARAAESDSQSGARARGTRRCAGGRECVDCLVSADAVQPDAARPARHSPASGSNAAPKPARRSRSVADRAAAADTSDTHAVIMRRMPSSPRRRSATCA
mmetsp:Transcript_1632/g.5236  ORF Transcript_1632/g.5236 Transcript_1632/m.5236 type:complete len:459 (+) Transcript_1632:931-2307(+)